MVTSHRCSSRDLPSGHRNLTNASVVSLGRSSSTQWPVSFSTTTITSVATNFICCPSASPSDLSPPITRTISVLHPADAAKNFRKIQRFDRDTTSFQQLFAIAHGVEGSGPGANRPDAQVLQAFHNPADSSKPFEIFLKLF